MIIATTPARFPRGTADADGRRAFVRGLGGGVLALDLASGTVLWRAPAPWAPLAALQDSAIMVRVSGSSALQFARFVAADGRELWTSPSAALPDWADLSGDRDADLVLAAETSGHDLLVRWSLRTHYRGGAPPSPTVAAAARKQAHGALRLSIESGNASLAPQVEDAAVPPAAGEVPAPDTVEESEIGNLRFQLSATVAGGQVRLLVRASDKRTGQTTWEHVIDEAPQLRPRALRP